MKKYFIISLSDHVMLTHVLDAKLLDSLRRGKIMVIDSETNRIAKTCVANFPIWARIVPLFVVSPDVFIGQAQKAKPALTFFQQFIEKTFSRSARSPLKKL